MSIAQHCEKKPELCRVGLIIKVTAPPHIAKLGLTNPIFMVIFKWKERV